MKPELIISIIALAFSTLSTLISVALAIRQMKASTISGNHSTIIGVEKTLGGLPSALKFHGITEEELKKADVTPEEFAYLVTSFTAGGIYYRSLFMSSGPFKEDSYRYNMCSQPSTQRAWPLIRRMMSDTVYRKKIDKTVAATSQEQRQVTTFNKTATSMAANDDVLAAQRDLEMASKS